jgi:hypothetical protein
MSSAPPRRWSPRRKFALAGVAGAALFGGLSLWATYNMCHLANERAVVHGGTIDSASDPDAGGQEQAAEFRGVAIAPVPSASASAAQPPRPLHPFHETLGPRRESNCEAGDPLCSGI